MQLNKQKHHLKMFCIQEIHFYMLLVNFETLWHFSAAVTQHHPTVTKLYSAHLNALKIWVSITHSYFLGVTEEQL